MEDLYLVLVTAPSDAAPALGRAMVEKRLCACVNLIPSVTSVYWWEGKVEEGQEVLMLFKTPQTLYAQFEAELKALHPYSVPEVLALPVAGGSAEYLRWALESCKKQT